MMVRSRFSLQSEKPFLPEKIPLRISACLLGLHCRYDGHHSLCTSLVEFIASMPVIPFCPEQLGGLPTPRPPAEIRHGDGSDIISGRAKVINSEGKDVTDAFRRGAMEALNLAQLTGTSIAIMKSRSPSCGLQTPCCDKATGMGVTAALFESKGIRIFDLGSDDNFSAHEFMGPVHKIYT